MDSPQNTRDQVAVEEVGFLGRIGAEDGQCTSAGPQGHDH